MWRPENWSNPYHQEPQGNFVADEANPKYCTYEAGADAMLEALLKLPVPNDIKNALLEMDKQGKTDWRRPNGRVIFIPDEE
jgi:hypothetical protein